MALSRLAQQFADEIRNHDWSDAPYRVDRAGHRHDDDRNPGKQLDAVETDRIRTNVMWVTAQVLGYNDPNFDVNEFAGQCGVEIRTRSGRINGGIWAGIRSTNGKYDPPGREPELMAPKS
ncbi:hypothetical protein [Polymorphospora lycopeni]|uniref:Uncharacterized protein n=1 Tax=Polymorphospora lycopeni TaxID=3140240 RepID=A0ABV5CPG8_9ACTN